MRLETRNGQRGFMTIEIVAAIGVLGIMGFGAFGLYRFGIDQLRISTERTVAVRALENEAERLRAVPLSDLMENDGQAFNGVMPELEGLRDGTTLISVAPYGDDPRARVVTLSVHWSSHAGRVITEELSTLRAF